MNNETGPAVKNRQRWILVLLVIVFIAPITLSWVLFNFTPLGETGGGASHGTLIQPPRQLPDLPLQAIGPGSRSTANLYGKWSLVYLVDGVCNSECDQNLYRMRQLRLAQGRDGTRVQRVLINLGERDILLTDRQLQEYAGQMIARPDNPSELLRQFRLQQSDSPIEANRLYLVDPRGYLMMSYAGDAEPGGIIDDMKRLLKYSSVG